MKLLTSIIGLGVLTVSSLSLSGQVAAQQPDAVNAGEKQGIPYVNHKQFVNGVGLAFSMERYDLLEQTVKPMREGSVEFAWGMPRLRTFYEGTLLDYVTDAQKTAYIEAWRKAHPKSKAALLVASQSHIALAWQARGQDFANTVTEEGALGFREHMEKAAGYLAEAKKLPEVDADYYAQQIEVAKCLAWPREEVDAIAAELLEKAPKYYPAHCSMAEYLLPRWHGEPGEMEAYAAKVANTIGGETGAIVYARIAERVRRYYPARDFFNRTDFDYQIMREGLEARLRMSPELLPLRHLLCYYACQKLDMATAHKHFSYLKEHGDSFSEAIWKQEATFDRWRELATNFEAFAEPNTLSVPAYHDGSIHAAFLADNQRVITSHPRGEVRVFDATSGKYLATVFDFGKYRSGMNWFSKYGHRLWIDLPLEAEADDAARSTAMLLLDLTGQGEGLKRMNFPGMHFRRYTFSDDGTRFASHPNNGIFCLGNLNDAGENHVVKLQYGGGWPAFSPDGTRLVVLNRQQPILLDTATGKQLPGNLPPLTSSLVHMFFSTDGKTLYFCGRENTIIWDIDKRQLVAEHAEPKQMLAESVAVVSRNRRWIATRTEGSVVIWDVENWREAYRSPKHSTGIQTLAFSHDSSKLVIGSSRMGIFKVWDLTKILAE